MCIRICRCLYTNVNPLKVYLSRLITYDVLHKFTNLSTDLVSALSSLNVYDFSHDVGCFVWFESPQYKSDVRIVFVMKSAPVYIARLIFTECVFKTVLVVLNMPL